MKERFKVRFKKIENGIERTSYGYYEDYEDFRSRNSTLIFVKMTTIKELY